MGAPPTASDGQLEDIRDRTPLYLLPIKNLNAMNMPIFVDTAAAMVKMMNSRLHE